MSSSKGNVAQLVSFGAGAVLCGALLVGCQSGGDKNLPLLTLGFADTAWTGERIPEGQQCSKFGGKGATPAMAVSDIPAGTVEIVAEFNDRSYAPLSSGGGHGKIGFSHDGSAEAVLQSVLGETADLPAGTHVVAKNRATGSFARPGYLPPCSGGKGNTYFADIIAIDGAGQALAKGQIIIGRY